MSIRGVWSGRKRVALVAVCALVALTAIGAGGWYYYTHNVQAQTSNGEETIQTTTVRRGSLVVAASGTGTLVSNAELELSFSSGGLLTEVLVEVGDEVQAGDVLARLDDTDGQGQVAEAETNLRLAELQLAELTGTPDAAELAAAQYQLTSAQEALEDLLNGPSAEEILIEQADLATAEMALQQAQAAYDGISWRPGAAMTSQALELQSATADYDRARANYDLAMAAASAEEIASARANVAQAQASLNSLLNSATAGDLETAQLNVEQARRSLESAQSALEDTVLTAPFAGTVTSVAASAGEMVGTSSMVTLADLSEPSVEFYLDETDLELIAVGYAVEVTFDALPDAVFTGHVVSVAPALVEVSGAPAIQALAKLEPEEEQSSVLATLPMGLNATVEVIAGSAENVLLVPAEALREIAPGEYAVFVVLDGQPQMRQVEVGLMDYSYAEIISGLELGDLVSTGTVETE
ncbi:MAG TPA: efflux RND transporter periplasmic adaptor subunit [Anaerolineae bacterium]|nr:efflux RND transporter periplasmic adaptor subunit [Anaerolineae bacterium]